jgi:dTDP-4-dehydrorhamnose reductase
MKVLIFGANGLLGTSLCQRLQDEGHEVIRFARTKDAPTSSESEISRSFAQTLIQTKPSCVINLVAATSVDECEKDMGYAALLNCFVPNILSHLCSAHSAHLIHISSDQVYNGIGPHLEESAHPINVYALTKLVGEYAVLQSTGCVLRTNFFGKSKTTKRTSFSDWLVQAGRKGTKLNVFDDIFFSPLGIDSLCDAILRVIQIRLTGLYNLGSRAEGISKAEFAKLLFTRLALNTTQLNFIGVDDAQLAAPRPRDMRMDSSAFSCAASFQIPTIEKEIAHEATYYEQ